MHFYMIWLITVNDTHLLMHGNWYITKHNKFIGMKLLYQLCNHPIRNLFLFLAIVILTNACRKTNSINPPVEPAPPADISLQLFQLTDLPQLILEISPEQ